ncbi:MAG TPA: hypothetical protein VH370_06725 [Humisphaera sp.]|jgi:hypothetical protein|nr:hypothetical protein [Humisphaera sp.]
MTRKQINLILWWAAGAAAAGAALCLALAILLPIESSADSHERVAIAQLKPTNSTTPLPALNSFQSIWDKSLRGQLAQSDDAPPSGAAPSNVVTSGDSGTTLTLLGTIGESLAMIRMPDGTTELRQVGEQIAGAQILAIRPYQIDIRLDGRTITIAKVQETTINPISPANGAVVSTPGK